MDYSLQSNMQLQGEVVKGTFEVTRYFATFDVPDKVIAVQAQLK